MFERGRERSDREGILVYVAHCFLRKSCVLECGDAKKRRYASLLLLVEFVAILLLYRGLLMSCFLFRVKTRADCAGMLRFSFILFFVVHAFALLSSWVFALHLFVS